MRDPYRPSLSLAHWIAWISACAVYLAVSRSFLPSPPQTVAQHLLLWCLVGFTGLCWTGGLVTLEALRRGGRHLIEPGLWLMLSIGMILAAELIVAALPNQFAERKPGALVAVTSLAVVLPALSRRLATRWGILFIVLAILEVVRLGGITLAGFGPAYLIGLDGWPTFHRVRAVVGLVTLAGLIAWDARARLHRSPLHWTGVTCAVVWFLWQSRSP